MHTSRQGLRPDGLALSDHVRAEQVKLDCPGDVGLAGFAGGEVAGFPGLAGPARSGRTRTKAAGARIFSKKVASARSACSGGKSGDGIGRGGQGMREADRVRGDARGGCPEDGGDADAATARSKS